MRDIDHINMLCMKDQIFLFFEASVLKKFCINSSSPLKQKRGKGYKTNPKKIYVNIL